MATGKKTVKFTKTTELTKTQYREGQVIFNEQDHKIYLDWNGTREAYAVNGTPPSWYNDFVRFRGISSTDPMEGVVVINGSILKPTQNDLIIYNSIHYIYTRNEQDILTWVQLNAPDQIIVQPVWAKDED